MNNSISQTTSVVYKKYWKQFILFCKELRLPTRRRQVTSSVELWIASLSKEGLSCGSVRTRLAALRHQYKKSEILIKSHKIDMMLNGLKKKKRVMHTKHPVTESHLKRLHRASYKLEPQLALLFRAITSAMFFGFLRPSEVCASSSGHQLQLRDIKFNRSSTCHLRLRSFKHSKRAAVITIREPLGGFTRPVMNIREYYKTLPSERNRPLFDLSVGEFNNLLQEVCQLAKIKTKLTSHCFRVGGATWADKHGWSESRIRSHGRWSSMAYRLYIKA